MHIEESANVDTFISLTQATPATPEKVFEELFKLLEDYGPAWYTQELHNRAVAVAVLYERGR